MKIESLTALALGGLVVLSGACGRRQAPAPSAGPQAAAPAVAPAVLPAAAPTAGTATIAELPDYPGANRLKLEAEAKAGFTRVLEAKFVTADPLPTVRGFYAAAIAANGWQVTEVADGAKQVKWRLAKGTSVAKVELEAEHGSVEIELERKDR